MSQSDMHVQMGEGHIDTNFVFCYFRAMKNVTITLPMMSPSGCEFGPPSRTVAYRGGWRN